MSIARRMSLAVLLVAGTACNQDATMQTVPPTPVDPPVVATDDLPHRIWWRSDGGAREPPILAATPGGEPLAGEWKGGYFCEFDGRPWTVWRGSPFGSAHGTMYHSHWVWIERDGVRWWLFSRDRRDDGTDPAFTDEQRTLLGRWLHREERLPDEEGFPTEDRLHTEVELLEGGVARTREGESWEWISVGACLEIKRPIRTEKRAVRLVLNCILDADRKSYRLDDVVLGTRLDAAK